MPELSIRKPASKNRKSLSTELESITAHDLSPQLGSRYLLNQHPEVAAFWYACFLNIDQNINDLYYKLYVSPHPCCTKIVAGKVMQVCNDLAVPAFKVGVGMQGLLRPDKIVLYFPDLNALMHTARIIQQQLQSFSAQGVPFTMPLSPSGMLSYAVEPGLSVSKDYANTSWRMYVADQVALRIKHQYSLQPYPQAADILGSLQYYHISVDSWNGANPAS